MSLNSISDDTVLCLIFPSLDININHLCECINKTIQILSIGHIWHQEEFKVQVISNHDYCDHLASSTCFGDNIEDEWFIVYLALEITKQFDVVIQIYDNDGEFLLIEAAEVLPHWANPENTSKRVFLYKNCIHLIPPTVIELDSEIKLIDAVNIIIDNKEQTASPEIYQAIYRRICNYPNKINQNIHNAVVSLPVNIATILTMKPYLISPIVKAYCCHDSIEAKQYKNVKYDDCVTTSVKFTKCLYAMLINSKYPEHARLVRGNENEKQYEIGLKLTCGYETLMSKLKIDIFSSGEFKKFLKSLTDNGYFKDNLEGSKDYHSLLENAKTFFLNMGQSQNLEVCTEIQQIMNCEEFAILKNKLRNNAQENFRSDNDDWLKISSEQLENILNSRYCNNNDVLDSSKITSDLTDFLKQSSDLEGIETTEEGDIDSGNIEFDVEQFITSLNNMINLSTSSIDDLDSDDDEAVDEDEVQDFDVELAHKLYKDEKQNNKTPFISILQSVKEEEGSSGPASNILRNVGVNKTDLMSKNFK